MFSHSYPRPQLERPEWQPLNGMWEFAIDREARWQQPAEVEWASEILVPFAPETAASGIGDTSLYRSCWYRRTFEAPHLEDGQALILHFGAVDYTAKVWVNGHCVAQHEGGYTPFSADVTLALAAGDQPQEIVVRAEDDPADLAKPRGKQDWEQHPHSIWYPRTTGIWQTVWMEVVSKTYLHTLRWTPSLDRWEIHMSARTAGLRQENLKLRVRMSSRDQVLADDTYAVVNGEVHRSIQFSDPGIDDYRNKLLWSPRQPTLIDAELELTTPEGQVLDRVKSYTALRSIGVQGDRFVLNGRPLMLRMVLDQGYWPDTGLTAPDDDALRQDVELAKSMGFNGVRKHQKIEDPRYLYWADRLGLLVWEEMPSAYRFTDVSVHRLTREWKAVMDRDVSHPCIVAWVPFNESWGVPDLPDSPAQRNYIRATYYLTKTLDPTRPVIGNDGWEGIATDILGIHDYDENPDSILRRYSGEEPGRLLRTERPGGRMLTLDGLKPGMPIMLTEFGGICFAGDRDSTWGYSRAESSKNFAERYTKLLGAVNSVPSLAGFCYTQFSDTYQEANGLLYSDRRPKFPLPEIERATAGHKVQRRPAFELVWREVLMQAQRQQTEEET